MKQEYKKKFIIFMILSLGIVVSSVIYLFG